MKGFLSLSGILLVLFSIAVWQAWTARTSGVLLTTTDDPRSAFAEIPWEEFTRDRANRMVGTVLDARGRPLAGADVAVHTTARLVASASTTEPGSWPAPEPEHAAIAATDGGYAFADLEYGSKLAIFRHAGHETRVSPEISFADGYGAEGIDGALPAERARAIVLREADGSPAAGVAVRALPRVWGVAPFAGVTDADGRLALPAPLFGGVEWPRLLAGGPGVLFQPLADSVLATPDDGVESVRELRLPEARPVVVEFGDELDGELLLHFLPAHAARSGWHSEPVVVREGRVELPRVRRVPFTLVAELPGRARLAVAPLPAEADTLSVTLIPTRTLTLDVRGPAGEVLHANAAWQPTPFSPAPVFEARDPFPWVESADPLRRYASHADGGSLVLEDVPAVDGWITVEAGGFAPVTVACAADPELVRLEIGLEAAVELAIRTDRPYLPVQVEVAGSPTQHGRSDAATEAFVWVPSGPVVVRSGMTRKGRTYPKGVWADAHGAKLAFSILDDRGRPRGCVYGFVTGPNGAPVPEANVVLQGSDGRPQMGTADEHGFYRFTDLESGGYVVFARPEDFDDAAWRLESVFLGGTPGEEGETRHDLQVWPERLELPAAGLASGDLVQVLDDEGATVWTVPITDSTDPPRLSNVPPGRYTIVATNADGEGARPMGVVRFGAGGGMPAATPTHADPAHPAEHDPFHQHEEGE